MGESLITRRGSGGISGYTFEFSPHSSTVFAQSNIVLGELNEAIRALGWGFGVRYINSDSTHLYVFCENYQYSLLVKFDIKTLEYIGHILKTGYVWGASNVFILDNNYIYIRWKNNLVEVYNKSTLAYVTALADSGLSTSSCLTQDANNIYVGGESSLRKYQKETWTQSSTSTNPFRWLLFAHGKLYGAYTNDSTYIRTHNTSTLAVSEVITSSIAQYNYVNETPTGIVMTGLGVRHFNATTKTTTGSDFNITYKNISYSNVWNGSQQLNSVKDGYIYTANQYYFGVYDSANIAQPVYLGPSQGITTPMLDANSSLMTYITLSPLANTIPLINYQLSFESGAAIKKVRSDKNDIHIWNRDKFKRYR